VVIGGEDVGFLGPHFEESKRDIVPECEPVRASKGEEEFGAFGCVAVWVRRISARRYYSRCKVGGLLYWLVCTTPNQNALAIAICFPDTPSTFAFIDSLSRVGQLQAFTHTSRSVNVFMSNRRVETASSSSNWMSRC
jgi:hypothetical protein